MGVEPPPPPLLPPLVGFDVGLGAGVGVGVGAGVVLHGFDLGQHFPLGLVPYRHPVGVGVGAGVADAVAVGVELVAAATPETPASISATTPGSSAIAVRPLGRRGRVSMLMTFAFIDVLQLWS